MSSRASNSPHSTPRSRKKEKVEPELTPEELAKKARKTQKKEELTREHDKIISEIEQSEQPSALKEVILSKYCTIHKLTVLSLYDELPSQSSGLL